jgi:hypothetical protein
MCIDYLTLIGEDGTYQDWDLELWCDAYFDLTYYY